jgi:hypothetical protein
LLPLVWALALPAGAQDGKFPGNLDVPFVPTNHPTVDAMLRLAGVGPNDFVIDLGSGDGRILIAAAKKHGARGFGVDLDPQRVRESTANAREAGVSDRVQFYHRNLFETRIAEATVVTMYLLPKVNLELRPRLFAELKPGTRIVSHDFDMGDWKPDLQTSVRGVKSQVYYWVMPAQVAGVWKVHVGAGRGGQDYELDVTQKHQEINVVARRAGKQLLVLGPRVDGESIGFSLVDSDETVLRRRFEGRVTGNAMEGTAQGEANAPRGTFPWKATKQ